MLILGYTLASFRGPCFRALRSEFIFPPSQQPTISLMYLHIVCSQHFHVVSKILVVCQIGLHMLSGPNYIQTYWCLGLKFVLVLASETVFNREYVFKVTTGKHQKACF